MTPEQRFHKFKHYIPVTVSRLFGSVDNFSSKYGLDKDDLIQLGNIGLWYACTNYDQNKSSFKTYAIYCIRWSIFTGIQNSKNVYYKTIHNSKENEVEILSLNLQFEDNEGEPYTLLDTIKSEEYETEKTALNSIYHEYIKNKLSNIDYKIFKLISDGYSHAEIGKKLGMSRQAIAARIKKAKKRLENIEKAVV